MIQLTKFSENFKKAFGNSKYTQKQLAKELGVLQGTISRWINGTREPSNLELLFLICSKLNITPTDLLGYNEIDKEIFSKKYFMALELSEDILYDDTEIYEELKKFDK